MSNESNTVKEDFEKYIKGKCTVFEQNFQNMFIKELKESQVVAKSG